MTIQGRKTITYHRNKEEKKKPQVLTPRYIKKKHFFYHTAGVACPSTLNLQIDLNRSIN